MFKAASSSASTNVVHVRDNNDYVVVEAFEIENGDMDHENNTTTEADHAVTDDDDARQVAAAAAAAVLDPHGAAAVAASSGRSGSSLAGAVVGIVKAMVGPAILFLPHGFATTGYLLALPILVGATILYLYSSACLLDSWQCAVLSKEDEKEQQQRQHDVMMPSNIMEVMPLQRRDEEEGESLSSSSSLEKDHHHHHHLGQTSTTTITSTPSLSYHELAFRAFGPSGEALIKIGIAAMQSGVCLTYLIFVPHNLTSSFATIRNGLLSVGTSTTSSSDYNDYNHGGHDKDDYDDDDMSYQVVYWWLLFMLLVEVPLSWIQDISHFVYTNSIANGLILYGLITCMGVALYQSAATSTTTTTTMWTMTMANSTNATTGSTAVQDGHPPHHTPYQPPPPPSEQQQQQQEWTLAVLLTNIHHHWEQLTPMEPSWFLFIGTSVLLFEGSITLLVPLQESVKDPIDRKRFPSVYKRVIVSIVSCYAVFGVTCWMAFGNDVHTVLTTSLPDGILATTVQLAYSVAVIFTFPLQHFPSLEIVTQSISNYFGSMASSDDNRKCCCCCCFTSTSPIRSILLHRNVIASAMVCLLALVALLTMESLDKVVSLMGSLLGCPIAFCFPPLIHCRLDPNLSKWKRRTNYLVAGLGFVAMVLASATTILQWRN